MLWSRPLLVALIVILIGGLAAAGQALHQEKKQSEGVEISVRRNGLSIREQQASAAALAQLFARIMLRTIG